MRRRRYFGRNWDRASEKGIRNNNLEAKKELSVKVDHRFRIVGVAGYRALNTVKIITANFFAFSIGRIFYFFPQYKCIRVPGPPPQKKKKPQLPKQSCLSSERDLKTSPKNNIHAACSAPTTVSIGSHPSFPRPRAPRPIIPTMSFLSKVRGLLLRMGI